jgi:hypothetical protein
MRRECIIFMVEKPADIRRERRWQRNPAVVNRSLTTEYQNRKTQTHEPEGGSK